MAYLEGSTGGYQGRVQAGRAIGTGRYAKARLVNSKQKELSFLSSTRVLSNRRPWQVRETVDHKGHWVNNIRNLYLPVTLQGDF